MKKKAVIVYAFVCVCLMPRHDYIMVFAMGAIFAWAIKEGAIDFLKKIDASGKLAVAAGLICILLSHVVGGFPIERETFGIYRYMDFFAFKQMWSIVAAALVIFGLWNVPFLQKVLSARPVRALGTLCYDFYLIHIPILFSLGTGLLMVLVDSGVSYNVAGFITFVATFTVIVILSYFYNKFEGSVCKNIEDKAIGWLSDKEQ